MDLTAVRALFDRTLRANPPPVAGVEQTWFDGVLRSMFGPHQTIGWWDFPPDRTGAIVAREVAHAGSIGGDLWWVVYGHDRQEGLERALADAGFEDMGLENFLAIEASAGANLARPRGVDVRAARTEEDLTSYAAVAREAYDDEEYMSARSREFWLPYLRAGTLFLAYADGEPAATGRLEAPKGCPMVGLFDGSVVPRHRGKGLYQALVADRAAEAARRGARYLYVNAWETSRPILERLGFEPLTTRHRWRLKAPAG